jgi:hypothetical protein
MSYQKSAGNQVWLRRMFLQEYGGNWRFFASWLIGKKFTEVF